MKAPQIIIICLYAASLLLAAYMHGKPKKDNHNFWTTFISACLYFALLAWGGFFK